jgi:NAD(P)-dependent dehydrogenase (short-subunit alcohol dehydrogenase family)
VQESAPSRIVVVSSIAHKWGEICKDNLLGEQRYDPFKAYCNSKLANVMFTRHLSKILDGSGVTVNTLHPGLVQTDIFRHSGT